MYNFESCRISKINLTFNEVANLTFNASKFALFCFMVLIFYFHLNNCILLVSFTVNHLKALLKVKELVFSGEAQTRVSSSVSGCQLQYRAQGWAQLGVCRRWGQQESVSQLLSSSPKQEFSGRTCKDAGIGKGKHSRSRRQSGAIMVSWEAHGGPIPAVGFGQVTLSPWASVSSFVKCG